jgi:hypothetical protein
MDGGSALMTAGASLLPVAYYLASSGCLPRMFSRIRKVGDVRKNVICLPMKGGKSTLSKSLVSNKNMLLIDLDEFIKTVNDAELLAKIAEAKASEDTGLYHILYSMAADKALDFVKKQTKADSRLKCVFLTSDFEWSMRRFKHDALYVAIPSHNLHNQILESASKEQRESIQRARTDFINRLPFESVKTYNSFGELESMIRARFDIQHKI